jgi:hypothetical protein
MDEDELKAKARESYELLLDRYEPKAKAIAVEAALSCMAATSRNSTL